MRHVSRCFLVLTAVLALVLPGDVPTAGTRTTAIGTAAEGVLAELDVQPSALTPDELVTLLDRLRASGIRVISTGVNWGAVQLEPAAPYQWAGLDRLVTLARERNLMVRFRVAGTPGWLHPGLTGVPAGDVQWYPPVGAVELAGWSTFLTDLTARYADRLAGVEIWNEPNESWFWKPQPDAAGFAALQRASYLAVKQVAPDLTVTSGGLSHNDLGFLGAYYDAAAAYPDAAANRWFFDQLGLHPYSGDRSPDLLTDRARYQGASGPMDENFLGMSRMVKLTATREGAAKQVWISEFGYSTVSNPWFSGVPDSRRAYFLARAYELAQRAGFVDGLGWYHSHPTPWDPPGYDILTATGETETFAQLARTTGARPPTTTLVSPVGSSTRGVVRVSGNRVGLRSAPALMELYVDGALVASGSRALSWDSRSIGNGGHTVQIVAWESTGTMHLGPALRTTVQN